jgi:hypothetical protein
MPKHQTFNTILHSLLNKRNPFIRLRLDRIPNHLLDLLYRALTQPSHRGLLNSSSIPRRRRNTFILDLRRIILHSIPPAIRLAILAAKLAHEKYGFRLDGGFLGLAGFSQFAQLVDLLLGFELTAFMREGFLVKDPVLLVLFREEGSDGRADSGCVSWATNSETMP